MMPFARGRARRSARLSSGLPRPDAAFARRNANVPRMPIALRAHALWKSYAAGVAGCSVRTWVLRGANLEVADGECVAVLGARGAGTSTLLHCLAGLRRADAGVVEHRRPPILASVDTLLSQVAEPACDRVLLLDDDHSLGSWRAPPRLPRDRLPAATIVVATHELERVRHVADRILLLRDGRLLPLDRAAGVRRVAEPSRATSGTREPARPGTGRA
jgi:energy-coupling factor transporter ATP-binding protein EcfA2